MNKLFLSVFVLLLSESSLCQSIADFNDLLKKQQTGKTFTVKSGKDISERTFMGTVKDERLQIKYYVVKEFLRIKAAIVYHGHSSLLFFNSKKALVMQAILSLPDELPYQLLNNTLSFYYTENGIQKSWTQNIMTLPRMLCVQPQSCYDITAPYQVKIKQDSGL